VNYFEGRTILLTGGTGSFGHHFTRTALAKWEQGTSPAGLTNVDKPVLVVNGDDDTMLPTISSFHLAQLLPDAELSIYPDSGHGGLFQHHELFVAQALDFLRD